MNPYEVVIMTHKMGTGEHVLPSEPRLIFAETMNAAIGKAVILEGWATEDIKDIHARPFNAI